jgi:hypothetical protein
MQQAWFVVSEKDALLGQRLRPPGARGQVCERSIERRADLISATIVPSPGGDKGRRPDR